MRFPLKTALAFAVCAVALLVFHRGNSGKGLSLSIFRDAVSFRSLHPRPAPLLPTIPLPTNAVHGRPPLSDFLFDDSGSLDPFFTALTKLETVKGSGDHITILHYGDSPTTADLITGDVRSLLQQRFGDAGHGYLLVAKPWAWYGHRDTDLSGHGWTISTAVGKMRADTYGLGGASFQGTSGASSTITLRNAGQSTMELSFLAQPGGGTLSISADDDAGKDQPLATVDTAAPESQPSRHPAWQTIPLPPGTSAVDIRPVGGHVELFGETFTRAQSGILYDSLGLNGASTTVLSRGFDPGAWAAELRHASPALVVINYGTNESGFGSFVDKQYEGELRIAIQRIRNALPNVSILIMSPMDRGEHVGIDEIRTMDTIPRIVAIQRRVAIEQHCAFFDTFDAMGGEGTMSRWYNGKPRLVAADFIHPTPQGASIVAQIFVKNLMQGFDGFKMHPAGVSQPAPAQPHAGKPSATQPEAKQVTQR